MRTWSLYNREEKLRIDDLSLEQVKIILLSISSRRMHEWYACQTGDLSWKPLAEVPEYLHEVRSIQQETVSIKKAAGQDFSHGRSPRSSVAKSKKPKSRLKAVPQPEPTKEIDAGQILTIHDLVVDKSQTQERRSARRYTRKLSFQVTKDQNQFESQTVDISMNGLSLKEPLPDWVPRSFAAKLQLNQYSISIQCEKVSDQKLKITAAESWDLIRQWIVNW